MECQQRYSARIVGAEETESSGVETAVHELRMEMTLHRETTDSGCTMESPVSDTGQWCISGGRPLQWRALAGY